MSKPISLFIALLCAPLIHKLYATINSAHIVNSGSIKHLAVIMDGNRRWAERQKLLRSMGHKQGAQTVKMLIQFCLSRSIKIVSVYAFSLENFKRSPQEIQELFSLVTEQAKSMTPELKKQGVKIQFIGDIEAAPKDLRESIKEIQSETSHGKNLLLNILFCYGGRQEILTAIKQIVKDVQEGKLKKAPTEELFKKYLWTTDLPDPDLIIRTGGIYRLSNFLTYQTSYSELYFTDRLWPDLTVQDLEQALEEYSLRKRNFGK